MIRHEAETTLTVSRRYAWEIATNTDALDAAAGLPAIEYTDEPQENGLSRRVFEYRLKGLRVEGVEDPFTWDFPRGFRVERIYTRGPFTRTVHTCELTSVDELDPTQGTVVRNVFEFEPAGLLGRIFAHGFSKEVMPKMDAWMRDRDAELKAALRADVDPSATALDIVPLLCRPGDDFGKPATSRESETIDRLIAAARRIADLPELDDLRDLLLTGTEYDVARLRPYALAKAWGTETRPTLRACLAATKAGLLRLRWDVICPHCRGDKDHLARLADVRSEAYCSSCNVDFDVDLDRSLEAVFVPHEQARVAPGPKYCLGGPGATRHIFHQRLLAPGEVLTPSLELPEGTYRIRASGVSAFRWLHVREDTDEMATTSGSFSQLGSQRMMSVNDHIDIVDDDMEGVDPVVAPFDGRAIAIRNRSSEPRLVCVESIAWAEDSLAAGELVADQQFRDLFSTEMLTGGVSLSIESVTILFTDLVGSTAMYGALGDAKAFNLVWIHFDLLVDIVRARGGAIVKTIGDAIMATFVRPADAVLAAADLHDRIADHVRDAGHDYPVALKIGIHSGPSIVVTLNDRLDYFGTTVNLAARTEAQSRGADIVLTKTTLENAEGAEAVLEAKGYRAEEFEGDAKGFDAPIPMVRWVR